MSAFPAPLQSRELLGFKPAMSTILSNSCVKQPRPLQIVHYNGPPKHNPRKPPTQKTPSREDDLKVNGVEVVDLMFSAKNEADYEARGTGIEKKNASIHNLVKDQRSISMPVFQGDTEDETRREPASSESCNQENMDTINHSDLNSDRTLGDHHKDATSRTENPLDASSSPTPDYRNRDFTHSSDMNKLKKVGKAKNQADELSQTRLPSSPPIGPSTADIKPSTEEAARYRDTEVAMPQCTTRGRVQSEAPIPTIEIASRDGNDRKSSSGGLKTTSPTGKRKRVLSTGGTIRKRQDREASTIRAADSTQRQKPSLTPEKALQFADMLDLDCGSASDDTEYEVERILTVRLYRGHLKYQAQWAGYEADPEWYNASNFKHSPLKLREFHKANPAAPGPPRRLGYWERCCEEDREAEDLSDDDKPFKIARGDVRLLD